jgi:uncharacterized membrane protein
VTAPPATSGPHPASATGGLAPAAGHLRGDRPDLVLPSAEDPVAAAAVEAVGGPPGRHARLAERRFWTPVRVVIALVLITCTLGFLQKNPCRINAWTDSYQYTRACYNDPYPLYGGRGFAGEGLPYVDNELEYPVVIGGLMQVAAVAVEVFPESERAVRFFDVTAVMMAGAAVVLAGATALTHRRRPWDAALLVTAPALVLTAFNNWDLAAAALLALAMLAWARRHPAWAGLFFGLGTATKLYPVLLLGPLFLLCLRAGRLKELLGTVGVAAAAWGAVNLPVALASPDGWRHFYSFSEERGADWGSLWYLLQTAGVRFDTGLAEGEAPHTLNTLASLTFLLGCLGVAVLVLRAPRRPRVPQVMFLTLLAFLLTNKVWSPQFVIWILPLAVLARPRWRGFLGWQATEVLAFFAIWYYLIGVSTPGEGISSSWYFGAILLRDAALLLLAALVVREVLHPEHDVVRRDGSDDPAGGVLDGAPDWPVLTRYLGRPGPSAPVPADASPAGA